MADVEVQVGNEGVEVVLDTGSLVVSVLSDNDFEILQDQNSTIEITGTSTSINGLNITLYARFSIFIGGSPSAGELLFRHEMTDQVLIADEFALSRASSVTGSSGTVEFSIQKNGVEIGTCTFTSSDTGVYAGSGGNFVAGDILSLHAPDPADGTLAGVSFTIAASRVV